MTASGGHGLALLIGYLLGSIPFGLLLTSAAGLGDIRTIGSGNIGATNVLRTGNRTLAAATLLLDGLKGVLAVLLARALFGYNAALLAGIAVVLGHLFPVWLRFRGGKGVATGFGVLFAIAWPAGLLCAAVWIGTMKLSRISSFGALAAFLCAPGATLVFAGIKPAFVILVISGLIYWRHAPNIRRLLDGTEPRFGSAS